MRREQGIVSQLLDLSEFLLLDTTLHLLKV